MRSATTVRKCSTIIMIVNIFASVAIGGIIGEINKKSSAMVFLAVVVIVVGVFGAVMLDALFVGFADIIDNTYAAAHKDNDVTESIIHNDAGKKVQNKMNSSTIPQNKGASSSINQNRPLPNLSNAWFCDSCGQRNESSSTFCKGCGQKRMIM